MGVQCSLRDGHVEGNPVRESACEGQKDFRALAVFILGPTEQHPHPQLRFPGKGLLPVYESSLLYMETAGDYILGSLKNPSQALEAVRF